MLSQVKSELKTLEWDIHGYIIEWIYHSQGLM